MPEFTVNANRFDPYKTYKFRVRWDGRYIPGISHVSALRRTTDVTLNREGSAPSAARKSPGLTHYAPIVLRRGRTHDTSFEEWASLVSDFRAGPGSEVHLASMRKDIAIELLNEAGQLVMAFRVYRCWPSEYKALSDLEANGGSSAAIEELVLENEGWERDRDVPEPKEPA